MTTIYEKIKEISDKKKLSIGYVNDKAGLSNKAIYGWKKSIPKADNLKKVADVLNVSTDYLLGRSNIMNPTVFEDFTEAQKEIAYFINPYATREESAQIKQLVEIAKLSKRRL